MIMYALNDIDSNANMESMYNTTVYFLKYDACYPDTQITYAANDMILQTGSNVTYLVSLKAQSHARGDPWK